jgi:hypothetical protein
VPHEYVPAKNQEEPVHRVKRPRFDAKGFMAGLPKPLPRYTDAEHRRRSHAFQWVSIPNVFAFDSSLDSLRRRFPEFQFEYDDPAHGWVTEGKYKGTRGRRIRVRHNPHLHPTQAEKAADQ